MTDQAAVGCPRTSSFFPVSLNVARSRSVGMAPTLSRRPNGARGMIALRKNALRARQLPELLRPWERAPQARVGVSVVAVSAA